MCPVSWVAIACVGLPFRVDYRGYSRSHWRSSGSRRDQPTDPVRRLLPVYTSFRRIGSCGYCNPCRWRRTSHGRRPFCRFAQPTRRWRRRALWIPDLCMPSGHQAPVKRSAVEAPTVLLCFGAVTLAYLPVPLPERSMLSRAVRLTYPGITIRSFR